jgi:hypothetical protein
MSLLQERILRRAYSLLLARAMTPLRVVCALVALLAAPSLQAHHSFASTFDRERPLTVTGVITKVNWGNPHIWFFIDVTNADGTTTNWGFETNPPGLMQRVGITKERLKLGETITVDGFGTKDGSSNGAAQRIRFQDGRNVFAGIPGQEESGERQAPTGERP